MYIYIYCIMTILHFVTRQNSNLLSLLCSQFKPKLFLPFLLLPLTSFSKLSHVSSLSSVSCPNDTFFQKAQAIMPLFRHCSTMNCLKLIHGCILKSGFDQDLFAMGKVIEFSFVFGDIDYAASAFDSVENPDGFLWNTMIRGFGKNGKPEKAIDFYKRMKHKAVLADSFTFAFLFKVSWQMGSETLAKQLHGASLKHGLDFHFIVRNTLIYVYGFFGELDNAVLLFDEMLSRDLVSWNTIINCHVYCGKYEEALRLFSRMLQNGLHPDDTTFLSALSACSSLGVLDFGRQIHSFVNIAGFGNVVAVSNLLVHMYAQCGGVDEAVRMFNNILEKNLVSWNTMILALATHGRENEALALYSKMVEEKLESPDGITFLGVLSACSRCGMVDEGREYFNIMRKDYHIQPTVKHYGCMVDILGRAGMVEEAYQLIRSMPIECNAIVWRTLLAACQVHGNIKLGQRVREHLLQLEPDHSSDYVLLGNMYASTGQWSEVIKVRDLMQDRLVCKRKPGFSFIGNSFVNENLLLK